MRKSVLINGVFTLLVLACALALAGEGDPDNEPKKQDKSVKQELAVVLGASETTIAFTVTNGGDQILQTTRLATNYSRIVIVRPDGTRFEHFSWKDGIAPDPIAPGGSKTWKMAIEKLLDANEMTKPGTYHVAWKLNGNESAPLALIREKKDDAAKG